MLTYSGSMVRMLNFPKFGKVVPFRCQKSLWPKCVQARVGSRNYFSERSSSDGFMLKSLRHILNPHCYQKSASVQFLQSSPIFCSYYTTDAQQRKSEEFSSNALSSSSLLPTHVRAEITDDGMEENENDDEDRELNFRRELWNVGPGSISSFNFSPYANDSVTIQKLVQLGVKIYKWERKYGIPEFILKLDFQRDIERYLRFLVDVGVEPDNLGYHVTLNPHLLKESIENLNIRLDYLKSKNFSVEEIAQIINANPFWLSFSTRRIDRRLGYFQRTFELGGQQVRSLACKCPRLVTSNLGRTKDVTFKIKDCMGFEPKEIVTILLAHPEIWRIHPTKLWQRFDYLHNELKFSHEDLMHSPKLLLTALTTLGERVGFLQKLGRAQFNPEKPNFVSADNLIEGDDADFVVRIAKSSVVEFNEYLKTL